MPKGTNYGNPRGRELALEPAFHKDWPEPPESTSDYVQGSDNGRIGVAEWPLQAPEHNMKKSALGGDNRSDLGRLNIAGNGPVNDVSQESSEFYSTADGVPLFKVPTNPDASEVSRWFRGYSETLRSDFPATSEPTHG